MADDVTQHHKKLYELEKTMGEKGVYMQIISAVWEGKCMPSFSQKELIKFIVTRQDRIKAMSRVC